MASVVKEIEKIFAKGVDLRLNGNKLATKGPEFSLDAGSIDTLIRLKPRILAVFAGLGDGRIFPLTQGQKAQWFLHLLKPEVPSYNIGMAMRFSRRLSRSAMQQALMAVSAVHESARTVIRPITGEPMQFAGDTSFPILEGSGTVIAELDLMDVLVADLEKPFRLEIGPLVRAILYDLPDDESVLMLAGHHLICDGESVPILLEDLFKAYFSIKQDRIPSLSIPSKQYVDYCRWQIAYLGTGDAANALSYWKSELSKPPRYPVWPGTAAKGVSEHSGDTIRSLFGAGACAEIKTFCREAGVTPFCFFLSVLHVVLCDILGNSEFWIGYPVSARSSSAYARTLGYFVNILIFAGEARREITALNMLRQNQEKISGALRHRAYPYNLLVGKLGFSGSGNGNGPLGILINYQYSGFDSEYVEIGEAVTALKHEESEQLRMKAISVPNQHGQFDLVWSINDSAGSIVCDLKYRHQAVDVGLASRINRSLMSALKDFQKSGFRPFAIMGLLDPADTSSR